MPRIRECSARSRGFAVVRARAVRHVAFLSNSVAAWHCSRAWASSSPAWRSLQKRHMRRLRGMGSGPGARRADIFIYYTTAFVYALQWPVCCQ